MSLGLCSGLGLGGISVGVSVDLSLDFFFVMSVVIFRSSAALSLFGQHGLCEFIVCDFPITSGDQSPRDQFLFAPNVACCLDVLVVR